MLPGSVEERSCSFREKEDVSYQCNVMIQNHLQIVCSALVAMSAVSVRYNYECDASTYLASHAAFTRCTASSNETTDFPDTWPHRLGAT